MSDATNVKESSVPARTAAFLLVLAACASCSTAPRWETSLSMNELRSAPLALQENVLSTAGLPRRSHGTPPAPYLVGPQDELAVTVWGPRDIWTDITAQGGQTTQGTVVQDDGTIVLPLLRRVEVAGLTLPQAFVRIADAYRSTVGATFQVDGKVARFRSKPILLDGAVTRPGVGYLSPELTTLGEAIAGAGGGLHESADPMHGILVRDGTRYAIDYKGAQEGANDDQNILLRPGDRIFFPSRSSGVFYVMGEVGSQGVYPIPPNGITLLQALAVSKGPLMISANMESIYLVRAGGPSPVIYKLSLEQIIASRDLALAAGDRIFVPPTGLANWDRTMSQLLPGFAGTLGTYRIIAP